MRQMIAGFLVALAVGIAIGVLVDVVSPNPTYGLQIEAIGLAILIVLVVAIVARIRRWLPAASGLAIGVIVGVGVGPGPTPLPLVTGTIEVRLGLPEIKDVSALATCYVIDGALVELVTTDEGALRLADGRLVALSIGAAQQEPAALDRPLDIVVTIHSTTADGSPTETRMVSDASSTISISHAGATGSMAFSGLVVDDKSESREPIDVAGSVTWTCPE
jgi:hypothetical protein